MSRPTGVPVGLGPVLRKAAWGMLAPLALVTAAAGPLQGAVLLPQTADTIIPVTAPTIHTPPATRVVATVEVDLSSIGASLGSYQGRVRFNPGVATLVSATAGTFQGETDINVDSALVGMVAFAGASADASLNTGVTAILELTFDVVSGDGGETSPLTLEIDEVVTAGTITDLTSKLDVNHGAILVDPGDIGVRVVPSSLQLDTGQPFTVSVELDLSQTTAVPEAASGTITFDPAVLRIDSVKTGTMGGELQANTATAGTVSWAVASTSLPADPNVTVVVLHMTAIGLTGTSSALPLTLTELVNGANLESLLPFVVQGSTPVVGVGGGPRVWGDADFTWRDDPTNPAPVTATDALICLSAAVGVDTSVYETDACDVAPDSGTTYVGLVNSLDALVILTYAVGKPVGTAYRVGELR